MGAVEHTYAVIRHDRLIRDRRAGGIARDVQAAEVDPHALLRAEAVAGTIVKTGARRGRRERPRSAWLPQKQTLQISNPPRSESVRYGPTPRATA